MPNSAPPILSQAWIAPQKYAPAPKRVVQVQVRDQLVQKVHTRPVIYAPQRSPEELGAPPCSPGNTLGGMWFAELSMAPDLPGKRLAFASEPDRGPRHLRGRQPPGGPGRPAGRPGLCIDDAALRQPPRRPKGLRIRETSRGGHDAEEARPVADSGAKSVSRPIAQGWTTPKRNALPAKSRPSGHEGDLLVQNRVRKRARAH